MTCRLRSESPSDFGGYGERSSGASWAPMRSKCDDQLVTTTETDLVVIVVSASTQIMHPTRLERVTYSSVDCRLFKEDTAHFTRPDAPIGGC
jgi:hypothetical protein